MESHRKIVAACVEVWVSRQAEAFTDSEDHCEPGRHPTGIS